MSPLAFIDALPVVFWICKKIYGLHVGIQKTSPDFNDLEVSRSRFLSCVLDIDNNHGFASVLWSPNRTKGLKMVLLWVCFSYVAKGKATHTKNGHLAVYRAFQIIFAQIFRLARCTRTVRLQAYLIARACYNLRQMGCGLFI